MEGDRTEALDTGNTQVSRGTCGETTQEWYDGMETGKAQVGGCYCVDARRDAPEEREGGGLSLGGKSDDRSGGQRGREIKYVTISNRAYVKSSL